MTRTIYFFLLGILSITYGLSESSAQNTTPLSIEVLDNNVSGGGFQSDVTITEDGQTVYSSSDVSGIYKSTDGGLRFEAVSEGLTSNQVASLAITPDNDQILYAGTGNQGSSGGLFRSVDGGDTWALSGAGEQAQFSGNQSLNGDPIPDNQPRSNGDLIVVDPGSNSGTHTDDIVIAGSYSAGVRIFTRGGDTLASAVNTAGFVRSVASDPAVPNTVYAAIQFDNEEDNERERRNGIYKIDYSNPVNPVSTLEYATFRPEGLAVLPSGNVYGAIGIEGLVKYNGLIWSKINEGLSTGDPNRVWTAVTGYRRNNSDFVFAGVNNQGGRSNTNYSTVWRSLNGGNTWTGLVEVGTNVSDQIHGQNHDWWFRVNGFGNAGLGRTNSIVSSIEVARGNNPDLAFDDIIYVSGRGGIWKSETGGALWEPAVFNMQVTSNRGVAVNPNDPSQVVIANTDFVVLNSNNRFEGDDIIRDRPRNADSRGYDVVFDTRSDELILGTGDRDRNESGEVFVKPSDEVGDGNRDSWDDTELRLATNGGRAQAVSVGYHNGVRRTNRIILAAVENEGVYRYFQGSWRKTRGPDIGLTERSNFVWPDNQNSGVVYLVDLSTGLFRSNDGGRSWTNIWPTVKLRNRDFFNTGYIAADDSDPTTIYISIQGDVAPINGTLKVYRMTGADQRIFGNPNTDDDITDITTHSGNTRIIRPGPLVIDPDGRLWLTEQQNSQQSVDAGLFVMRNPKTDVTFEDVTTNEYRNAAIRPSGIDVSSDGFVYISQNGGGLVKAAIETPVLRGDVDRNGVVNFDDVSRFIELLTTGEFQVEGDFNEDGVVDSLDINPFVAVLRMLSN